MITIKNKKNNFLSSLIKKKNKIEKKIIKKITKNYGCPLNTSLLNIKASTIKLSEDISISLCKIEIICDFLNMAVITIKNNANTFMNKNYPW